MIYDKSTSFGEATLAAGAVVFPTVHTAGQGIPSVRDLANVGGIDPSYMSAQLLLKPGDGEEIDPTAVFSLIIEAKDHGETDWRVIGQRDISGAVYKKMQRLEAALSAGWFDAIRASGSGQALNAEIFLMTGKVGV